MNRGVLWLEAAASQSRFGVKGPRAAEWLGQQGLRVPARPNSWTPLRAQDRDDSHNVIARLGNVEFFLEEAGDGPGLESLERQLAGQHGVYPVLREDFAIVLGGIRAPDVLAQVCNVDLAALELASKPVVMTLVAGVSVLVLPQQAGPGDDPTLYRIWCDPSLGSYLWETLAQVVATTTNGRGG
jgi:sarcosine oxidase subunit gamma